MSLIQIVILIFMVLELSNILALYFAPHTRVANAVGMFAAWEKSKQDPEIHAFVRYLVYWVAGTKLIFIVAAGCDRDLRRLEYATHESSGADPGDGLLLLAHVSTDTEDGPPGAYRTQEVLHGTGACNCSHSGIISFSWIHLTRMPIDLHLSLR